MRCFTLIPHLKIQNANALSSPYTIGFPAMTAWLGFMHALQRKLNAFGYQDLRFTRIAVSSHRVDLKTYRERHVNSIVGSSNPLKEDGKRPSFQEEARCDLDVSLLIECEGLGLVDSVNYCSQVSAIIYGEMKAAGGDIVDIPQIQQLSVEGESDRRKLIRKMMPGYVLIERRDLVIEGMNQGLDALSVIMDCLEIKYRCEYSPSGEALWKQGRKESGWIVPIATGFQGLTPLGKVENQRDANTPHRFAESIITLGEFKMPYRLESLDEMLWHYHVDLETNLYLCQQNSNVK